MISDYLNRLKSDLISRGYSFNEVEGIVEEAAREIDAQTRDLVADAISQAQDAAESISATEFLNQINLNTSSGYIEISTDSGQLDFSTPPVPMLPWLLKGAKTSKSGNQYRIVPIGKSDGYSVPVKDVSSGIASIKNGSSIADTALMIAKDFGLSSSRVQKKIKDPSPAQDFKTASTAQEGMGMWIKKATEKDMRPAIDDINHQLRSKIEETCIAVINKYRS